MELRFADLRYDCLQCGKSCTWNPELKLTPEAAERVTQHFQRPGYVPLKWVDGEARLNPAPEGNCTLNQDRLCRIHSELGYELKPLGCRMFPFLPVQTPDGFDVGVSFFCTAVQQNHGRPLSEHRELVEGILSELEAEPAQDWALQVDDTTQWNWTQYLDFEDRFRDFIRTGPSGGELLDYLYRVAPGSAREGARWFVGTACSMVVATLEFPDQPEARVEALDALEAGLPFKGMGGREVPYPQEHPWPDELTSELARYLDHLVFRKFLTRRRAVLLQRLLLLLVLRDVVIFYTNSEATRESRAPEMSDLHQAIGMAEQRFYYDLGLFDPLMVKISGLVFGASEA